MALIEYQIRIRNAAKTADAIAVTSVRGDGAPYIKGPPSGDGASFDPLTGQSIVAAYTGTIVDWPIGDMQRAITAQLEDGNQQQQQGYREAFVEFRLNGGAWVVLVAGILTLLRLTDAMTWEFTVNDYSRAQGGVQCFGAQDTTTLADFITEYTTNGFARGCLFGGPFLGDFTLAGGFRDLGGWSMKVNRAGVSPDYRYYLEPTLVYGPPTWAVNTRSKLTAFADAINEAAGQLMQLTAAPVAGAAFSTIRDAQANGQFGGLIYVINGVPFRPTTSGSYSGEFFNNNAPTQLVSTLKGKLGIFCVNDGQTPLVPGSIVQVHCLTILPSDISPVYYDGHPLDFEAQLWANATIPYDASAVTALKSDPAIGASSRIAFRFTGTQELSGLLSSAVSLPYGVGIRADTQGRLVPFRSRVIGATPPTVVITDADVVRGSTTLPFELDTATGVNTVSITMKSLQPATVTGSTAQTLDGVVESDIPYSYENTDLTAIPYGALSIAVPGMMHSDQSNYPLAGTALEPLVQEFFDRFGHGGQALETTLLRGGAGDVLKLGGECIVQLSQVPNHNYRLGDNPAISGRAMQIVHLTEQPSGRVVRLVDSGPNAQPLATVPVLSIAQSTDAPRTTATVTVTNAAALNALGYACRIQWVANTGATPAAGNFAQVLYFKAGAIPTTAQRLPAAIAGATVWAQGRSEKAATDRPSNYGTPVSVALSAIVAPSLNAAVLDIGDGSRATLNWTLDATTLADVLEVYLRLTSDPDTANVLVQTLPPGSITYTLQDLAPGTAYTATILARDPRTLDTSEVADVAFMTSGATVTLDPPTDANGFSGNQDARYGFARQDGIYGLAVAATEFPGYTEFAEELETAPNSGTYGSPVTVGTIANAQGDWTIYESVAPNDGLRRVLSAREVRDGANPSAYTIGVVVVPWTAQPLGLYSATVGANSIISVRKTLSADGASMLFVVTIGALVDQVHAHYRTMPISLVVPSSNPYDFSGDEDVTEDAFLMIQRRVAGESTVTFSFPLPVREFEIVGKFVPRTAPPLLKNGDAVNFNVDAAPPAINVKLLPSRATPTTADLQLVVVFGQSDKPVEIDVFEGSVDGAPLMTTTLTAPGTLDKTSFPVLGGRLLPLGDDSLSWHARATDVSGQEWWFGPATLGRVPLAKGAVTVGNYRANPPFVCAYNPDTTAIRITTHSGKVKTFDSAALLAAGSTVTWTATDPTDDSTSDAALAVDEARSGYLVEYEGGGTWITVWSGSLHGQPSNPPTAKIDLVPNTDADVESVFITPDTQVDEELLAFYRPGDTDTTPQYQLCASAISTAARSVIAGTRLGPSDYFVEIDGSGTPVGSPTTILDSIPLGRDQITRHGVMIEGVDSGVQSPWIPVVLSLLGKPWSASVHLAYDPASRTLSANIIAGARTASVGVLFADNDSFSAPITASGNVADGSAITLSTVLSAAQLGKPWYVQVTPFSAVSLGGLPGDIETDSVIVPAVIGDVQLSVAEASGDTTFTLSIDDPGAYLNNAWTNGTISGALHAQILNLGVVSQVAASTHTLVGTLNRWTFVVAQDRLHTIGVDLFDHFVDGSTGLVLHTSVDTNKVSDLSDSSIANNGTTANVILNWDPDTLNGAACARYSLDGGVTYTTGTVSSLLTTFSGIARISTPQTMLVQGKNALDGAWGNPYTLTIDAYLSESPTFDVHTIEGATTTAVYWSCTAGVATLSIDGGTAATPSSSPITVTRPAALGKKINYKFAFTNAGVTNTDAVDILPVDSDTVTPDLTFAPGTPTGTTQPFTVTASNPQTGGSAPTITVTCTGCTMTIGGTTYPDGTTETITSGTVVTGNRPANTTTTQAVLKCDASLAGGGTESIVVAILSQYGIGPIYSVDLVGGATTDVITWSCTRGTAQVSINGGTLGTPASSPITVTRPAAGAVKSTYAFTFAADGQTVSDSVDVMPLDADTVTPNLDVSAGTQTGTLSQFTVTAANPATYSGPAPTITLKPVGCSLILHDGFSTVVADGTTATVANYMVFDVTKPPTTQTTQATVRAVAAITSAGSETIVVTIPPQLNVGPSLTAAYVRLTSSTGQIVWACTNGTVTVKIDSASPTTPSASPIAITLDANTHSYLFAAVVDGQTISAPVSVPAVNAVSGFGTFSGLSATPDYVGNTVTFDWTYSIVPDGFYVRIVEVNVTHGTTPNLTSVSGSTTSHVYTPTVTILNSHTSDVTAITCTIEPFVVDTVGPSSKDIDDSEYY